MQHLSDDVLIHILGFLDWQSLRAVLCVCTAWQSAGKRTDAFWLGEAERELAVRALSSFSPFLAPSSGETWEAWFKKATPRLHYQHVARLKCIKGSLKSWRLVLGDTGSRAFLCKPAQKFEFPQSIWLRFTLSQDEWEHLQQLGKDRWHVVVEACLAETRYAAIDCLEPVPPASDLHRTVQSHRTGLYIWEERSQLQVAAYLHYQQLLQSYPGVLPQKLAIPMPSDAKLADFERASSLEIFVDLFGIRGTWDHTWEASCCAKLTRVPTPDGSKTEFVLTDMDSVHAVCKPQMYSEAVASGANALELLRRRLGYEEILADFSITDVDRQVLLVGRAGVELWVSEETDDEPRLWNLHFLLGQDEEATLESQLPRFWQYYVQFADRHSGMSPISVHIAKGDEA